MSSGINQLGNLAWLKSGNPAFIKQAQYIMHLACTFYLAGALILILSEAFLASGDLKSGLFWILNGRKEGQMVRISNEILNPVAQPFEF